MLNVTSTPVELIDDDTATTYYNDLDTLEGAERFASGPTRRMPTRDASSSTRSTKSTPTLMVM